MGWSPKIGPQGIIVKEDTDRSNLALLAKVEAMCQVHGIEVQVVHKTNAGGLGETDGGTVF